MLRINMRPRKVVDGIVLSVVTALLLMATADVPAASLASSVTIPVAGTVNGQPESVSLSGSLRIGSTVTSDPLTDDSIRERLVLKLVNVSGVGLTSGAKYVAAGENTMMRLGAASDQFEVTFPFFRDTPDGPLSARSATVSISLKLDLLTGSITAATASISTPKLAG